MPSSLTRVLPIALVFSTRLPVSDCGTGTLDLARHFSRQHGSLDFGLGPSPSLLGVDERTDLPVHSPYRLRRAQPKARSSYHTVSCHRSHLGSAPGLGRLAPVNLRSPTPRRHLAVQTISGGSGISTGCPSPTTFVLGLGPTNPEWTSLPQETLGLRRVGFSPTSRY